MRQDTKQAKVSGSLSNTHAGPRSSVKNNSMFTGSSGSLGEFRAGAGAKAGGARLVELAGKMRPYVNDHAIEAEMYLSRRSEMDSIHKRQLSAQRRRDSSLRQLEQRRCWSYRGKPSHYGLALGPLTNVPIKRTSSCFSGPLPAPIRKAPTSISANWPPEGRLGSCLTNTRSVSESTASNHRSPLALW
jgi:hypothetical protein